MDGLCGLDKELEDPGGGQAAAADEQDQVLGVADQDPSVFSEINHSLDCTQHHLTSGSVNLLLK